MSDENKTQEEQLIGELEQLRHYLIKTALSETEHNQAEEKLRKSFRKYAVEALVDTLYHDNLKNKFIYANEDSIYIFGYSLDEILESMPIIDEIMYSKVVKVFPCSPQNRFNSN